MKTFFRNLTATAVALFTLSASIPEAKAANVTLDGFGFYKIGNKVKFYNRGPEQTGRYRNLGSDYYHKVRIQTDFINNRSNSRSGSLSYEFWAMPFYGATSGIILMTRGLNPIPARGGYDDVSKEGLAISIAARRFPEINIWEFTRNGWKFRDSLTFTRKAYL
jgi:hypothetical protein